MTFATGLASCAKYVLALFNFLLVLGGVAAIVLGGIALSRLRAYGDMQSYTSIAIAVIVFGVFFLLLGILGCIGALQENVCMVSTFLAIMALILIADIASLAVVLTLRSRVDVLIVGELYKLMHNNDSSFDDIQSSFACCGVVNASDYDKKVPVSCCQEETKCNTDGSKPEQFFQKGCSSVLSAWMAWLLHITIVATVIVMVLEVVGIFFASAFVYAATNSKYNPV